MNTKTVVVILTLIFFITACSKSQSIEPQDETANWKTYRNEKYGFVVKYPPSIASFEDAFSIELASNLYICPLRGGGKGYILLTDKEFEQGVEIVKGAGNCQKISFEEYLQNYYGTHFINMDKINTSQALPIYAVKYWLEGFSPDGKISGTVITIVFVESSEIKDARAISFSLKIKDFEANIEKIFSTFKFTH